jgi:two-component system phosphate regulon response regulator OmpR
MYPEGQEILVVVDDRERRERVARILGDEGFSVTAAGEGLAALRAVGARHFALIVAATRLPGTLDGPTTVHQARSRQPWLKALYIVESGGRPERGNPDIDDFIAAPFERHELIGCTFELLQRGAFEVADLARRARTELRAS